MVRKCPKCYKTLDMDTRFCPDCKCMTRVFDDGIGTPKKKVESTGVYDDWDPPAPVTIYLLKYKVEYSEFKRHGGGTKYEQVVMDLDRHLFNCSTCGFFLEGECEKKGRKVTADSICKSFKP